MENLCATHLPKQYGEEACYNNKNIEVDFLVAEKGYAVQASYSVYGEGMQDTFDRETKALKQSDGFLPLQRMVIVTYDEEVTVPLDNGLMSSPPGNGYWNNLSHPLHYGRAFTLFSPYQQE